MHFEEFNFINMDGRFNSIFAQKALERHLAEVNPLISTMTTHKADTSVPGYSGANALELMDKPVPHVLIIDDDIEAILPIDMIFRELGCQTSFAIDVDEAVRKLESLPVDIIVLDWMLNRTTGGQVLEEVVQHKDLSLFHSNTKPKVITYSGLESHNITFPKSKFFDYVEHWVKPVKFNETTSRALQLLNKIGF